MDDALRHIALGLLSWFLCVLILVLMDDALRLEVTRYT